MRRGRFVAVEMLVMAVLGYASSPLSFYNVLFRYGDLVLWELWEYNIVRFYVCRWLAE